MANCDNLFQVFNNELQIPKSKRDAINISNNVLRDVIRKYFKENHPKYIPTFYKQGSCKTKNRIRTKDDLCDQDDGVYFVDNPDNVTGTTLQQWVKEAVAGITDSIPSHRKKCVTVDYKAGYNIDLPVFLFDKNKDKHPKLAVKNDDFKLDDPKEFIEEFKRIKDINGQLIRITRYLKAWCDFKREKMPSGLSMTVLAMKYLQKNDRDDIALKYTLIEIEKALKNSFECVMTTTPNEDLFGDYDENRKSNFMENLNNFIKDAKSAVDNEANQLKASRLWQKHFGNTYFPDGEDKDETKANSSNLSGVIGSAIPYLGNE